MEEGTPDIAAKLREIGAVVREIHEIGADNIKSEIFQTNGLKYQPIVASDMLSKLDREDSMKVLVEAEKIAKESEDYDVEIAQLSNLISRNYYTQEFCKD